MDRTGCFTSTDVMAGGCCCAAQQDGTLWLWGAGFGQRLQEGCLDCSACRQAAATLNSNVSRHSREANLCSAFFISSSSLLLDVPSANLTRSLMNFFSWLNGAAYIFAFDSI